MDYFKGNWITITALLWIFLFTRDIDSFLVFGIPVLVIVATFSLISSTRFNYFVGTLKTELTALTFIGIYALLVALGEDFSFDSLLILPLSFFLHSPIILIFSLFHKNGTLRIRKAYKGLYSPFKHKNKNLVYSYTLDKKFNVVKNEKEVIDTHQRVLDVGYFIPGIIGLCFMILVFVALSADIPGDMMGILYISSAQIMFSFQVIFSIIWIIKNYRTKKSRNERSYIRSSISYFLIAVFFLLFIILQHEPFSQKFFLLFYNFLT